MNLCCCIIILISNELKSLGIEKTCFMSSEKKNQHNRVKTDFPMAFQADALGHGKVLVQEGVQLPNGKPQKLHFFNLCPQRSNLKNAQSKLALGHHKKELFT